MTGRDHLPGFRRRFRVLPKSTHVTAAVEDDFHCMVVTLHHANGIVGAVQAAMERWPWTTCPGAVATLGTTFTGVVLAEVAARGLKTQNCTHLYDLAIIAAAHANDAEAMVYDVFVSDEIDGQKHAEICKDGAVILDWTIESDVLQAPKALAGTPLLQLRDWIAARDPATREAARILQWASLIAHGRSIPMAQQSDATRMPPNCHTFQPDRARIAERTGRTLDFSGTFRRPLDHFDGRRFVS